MLNPVTTAPFKSLCAIFALVCAAFAMSGCDQQRINELEEGVASEGDVRMKFGEPEKVWDGENGARIFEYNRQPAGAKNYMITIGTDGTMSALRQVLTPSVVAQVQVGMGQEQVRRLLGQPAKRMSFALKQKTDWDWRWIDPPAREMVFTVTFGPDGRVLRSGSSEKLPEGR